MGEEMKISIIGDVVYLTGDCTAATLNYKAIDSLYEGLELIGAEGKARVVVDCADLHFIDQYGARILSVWLSCLYLRGIDCVIVHVNVKCIHHLKPIKNSIQSKHQPLLFMACQKPINKVGGELNYEN